MKNNTYDGKDLKQLTDERNEFVDKDLFEFGLNNKLARDSCEILKPILDKAYILIL
jgi:hypothetical protein